VDLRVKSPAYWRRTFDCLPPRARPQADVHAHGDSPDERIIYNADTGALTYDSNGIAEGSATQFAKLAPHLALSNTDFFIT
jgi:Ca2+-binding RTX toxin-like protein